LKGGFSGGISEAVEKVGEKGRCGGGGLPSVRGELVEGREAG